MSAMSHQGCHLSFFYSKPIVMLYSLPFAPLLCCQYHVPANCKPIPTFAQTFPALFIDLRAILSVSSCQEYVKVSLMFYI